MPTRAAPRPGQPRQKTHGRWITSSGVEHLLSGESGPGYRAAYERAWELGIAPHPWKFDNASHVELKVAARMHKSWKNTGLPRHETIVLNNQPCNTDPLDCEYVIDK